MSDIELHRRISDRAIRLFTYLQELVQLRSPQVCDIENYEAVVWFSEIPDEDACFSISWSGPVDDSDLWLEIKKRKEPVCPALPASCRGWIDPRLLLKSDTEPQLLDRIFVMGDEGGDKSRSFNIASVEVEEERKWIVLSERPDVSEAWNSYLVERWRPWAETHNRWSIVHGIYGRLFTILQLHRSLGETYEFMLGLGLLTWVTSSGQKIRRHIVVGQASLEFDSNTGTLSVRPAADGVKLGLEMDMLEPCDRPNAEQVLALEKSLENCAESPWDRGSIEPVLRSWVHSLHSDGTYDPQDEPSPLADQIPKVTFAPAVFLRNRTSRSLVASFRAVIDQIKHGEEVPVGIQKLLELEILQTSPSVENDNSAESHEFKAESLVHFPLPANQEQMEVVERLNRDQGVLVQGPPGTGKSHTIANLICHLLAQGKRILVTSQTPRALKVLRAKIPRDLLPLGVSLLGNDRDSLKGLEDSVQGITNHYHGWNEKLNAAEIKKLELVTFELKKRRASIDSRLRELRERDTFTFVVADGTYKGTALEIARSLSERDQSRNWIPDAVDPDTTQPCTSLELLRLLSVHRHLTQERVHEISKDCFSLETMPSIQSFVELAQTESKVATDFDLCRETTLDTLFSPVSEAPLADRKEALSRLRELQAAIRSIESRPVAWLPSVLQSFLRGQEKMAEELRGLTGKQLDGLATEAKNAHSIKIEVLPTVNRRTLRADATDLRDHLQAGGSLGWGPFRKDVVKRARYILDGVRVNGRACNTVLVLNELILRLEVESKISLLWEAWHGIAERVVGSMPTQVAHITECNELLGEILALKPKLRDARTAATALGILNDVTWQESSQIQRLVKLLEVSMVEDSLRQCRAEIEAYCTSLRVLSVHPRAHPLVGKALDVLERRDVNGWGIVVADVEALTRDKKAHAWRCETESRLSKTVPRLMGLLRNTAADSTWDERLRHFEDSWNWARAQGWLTTYEKEHDIAALESERLRVDTQLGIDVGRLAAAKAWEHCFHRMTDDHRAYLEAWRKEIQKIGKGTGKYAETHRRTAQKYMSKCREAIPAWIMPMYRVAESIVPKKYCFDVVIVDEASQSGPEALILQYLAKQIVIVGDDQQISPEDVGVDQSSIFALQQRYLYDFDLKETFGAGYSLFGQAEIRYGNRIPLREHFRCMPEIIRFSNDLCYSANPLVPLRQYPPKRLEPIIVRAVPDGFREGGSQSARNQPEAEALVEAMCECCSDPAYDGKTMGVISLQGDYQAGLIQRLLKDRLGEQEMIRREIICGDAYAFQGDERDVIFMSMVAAPNERIGALTKDTDKRRFNVAASRPRDQVWLFHTASLSDLNQDDLRFKLLGYYLNPGASNLDGPDWDRCESQFERDVATEIHIRGFRLVLQFEPLGSGGKRIDILIEGLKNRLAVECDGDRWHGADEYEKDMFRQRQLERSGLVFWRIRGSEFYRDRLTSLAPLWPKLASMGIEPWDTTKEQTPRVTGDECPDSKVEAIHAVQRTLIEKPLRENLFTRPDDSTARIREVPRELVRSTLYACIPNGDFVPREELLKEVSRKLGYAKLGHNIRSTINRMIGAEVRAGRLATDWQKVWRTTSQSQIKVPS